MVRLPDMAASLLDKPSTKQFNILIWLLCFLLTYGVGQLSLLLLQWNDPYPVIDSGVSPGSLTLVFEVTVLPGTEADLN